VTAFVERALSFYASHGIVAKRFMTDNAFAYVKNRRLRELLTARAIAHRTTAPYRPRTNGCDAWRAPSGALVRLVSAWRGVTRRNGWLRSGCLCFELSASARRYRSGARLLA
jgi:hypothetical protein